MQELAFLILSEGDFETAKRLNVKQRSPFLEGTRDSDNIDGTDFAIQKCSRPRLLKTHLPYFFYEETFKKCKPKV